MTCRHETLALSPVPSMVAAVAVAAGCGEDFDPYNRLTGLRVLAIKAEPPAAGPGGECHAVARAGLHPTLTPLVFAPAGDVGHLPWSWCPLPGSASDGYPAAISDGGSWR